MMLFTKLALVTRAFYLALNVLLEATLFGPALWKGGAGIHFTRTGLVIFFGGMWLSFTLAYRIVATPIFAKILHR